MYHYLEAYNFVNKLYEQTLPERTLFSIDGMNSNRTIGNRKTYTTNIGVGYLHLAKIIGMDIIDDDIECTIELLDGTIQTCMYSNTSGNYRTCNIPYYDFFKKEKYCLYEEENDWKDKSKSFVIRTDYKHFPVLKHYLYIIAKHVKKWRTR